jgi:hypothetical protein
MKQFFILVSIFLLINFPISSESSQTEKITAEVVAENIYFNMIKHDEILKMVESLPLTKARQTQIKNFLKSRHLEKINTDLKWSEGSSVITISNKGQPEVKIDFATITTNKTVSVNGILIDASNDKNFTDVVAKFQNSLAPKKSSIHSLLIDVAFAESNLFASIFGAVAYWTGLDQLSACTGAELATVSECTFRPNASMIKSYLKNGDQITEFTCSKGQGLNSITIQDSNQIDLSLRAQHNPHGQITQLDTYQSGIQTCSYRLVDDRLIGVVVKTPAVDSYCHGQILGQYDTSRQPLKKDDRPRRVATILIPISRLDKCCLDSACRNEISNLAKKQHNNSSPEKIKDAIQ